MRSRELNAAYLERKLRAIGLVGSDPLQDLADLQGLLVLENDRPEWKLAANEFYYADRETAAAVAAQNSWIALVNPAGSNTLIVVESVNLTIGTACDLRMISPTGIPIPGDAGSATGQARDLRKPGQVSAGQVHFGASAAGIGFAFGAIAAAITHYFFTDTPFILGPNTGIALQNPTVNSGISAAFQWRERPIEGTFEMK